MPDKLDSYVANKHMLDIYDFRYDSHTFTEDSENGSLSGRAVVTTIGVFPYLLEDGTVFNELRLPEEVFAPDSLRSLQLIPITLDHPAEFVNSENMSELQVGVTGQDVSRLDLYDGEIYGSYKTDGTELSIPLKITRKDAIEAVKNGKRALSCGYSRDLELKEGTWGGIHYDGIQRNIRYNHVAIVDRGRAGDAAVIRMDNAFIPTYSEKEKELKDEDISIPDRRSNMKKMVIDSVSYELDDKVVDHMASVEKERDTAQAQLDMANIRIAELEKEMSGMIKADELPAKVREMQSVRDTADKYGVALDEKASVIEMKRTVLRKAVPSIALEGKSDTYVDGLFDAVKGFAPKSASTDSVEGRNDGSGDDGKDGDNDSERNDSVDDSVMSKEKRDALTTRLSKFSRR